MLVYFDKGRLALDHFDIILRCCNRVDINGVFLIHTCFGARHF